MPAKSTRASQEVCADPAAAPNFADVRVLAIQIFGPLITMTLQVVASARAGPMALSIHGVGALSRAGLPSSQYGMRGLGGSSTGVSRFANSLAMLSSRGSLASGLSQPPRTSMITSRRRSIVVTALFEVGASTL